MPWWPGSITAPCWSMASTPDCFFNSQPLGTYNKRTGKGHGECKLTGFCADECAIDGFRIAWRKGERDLTKLMEAAYDTWIKAAHADCEDQFSDEQFSENCEANGYEFYEDNHGHRLLACFDYHGLAMCVRVDDSQECELRWPGR